ncbi:uncharacterized protein LOC143557857 [Bidens hawaiensis]|uniref:uncharacterized protein LOC143557857 n=1 Tax=Bidens hawaiensis TaxID=980011 RepID=UPI00404B79BA
MDATLHPAMAVTNIKNMIPLILEDESSHFTTWTALFEVHCRAYQVYEHLLPRTPAPVPPTSSSAEDIAKALAAKVAADALWSRLDALVLQWIYGTISKPLLHIILIPGQTAYEAWLAIANHFNDNKCTRQILLQHQFSNIHLESFPNMAAYCQHAKHLADQLNGVGAPVDNQRLISVNVAPVSLWPNPRRNQSPPGQRPLRPPPLLQPPSHNLLSPPPRLLAAAGTADQETGDGGTSRGDRSNTNHPQHPYIVFPNSWTASQWSSLMQHSPPPGTTPCPYPSAPRTNTSSAGILGAAPAQAYTATLSPTDIQQALYALSLSQPDPNGVMDTGASSHMKTPQGTISPSSFNTCTSKFIVVGNGMTIPVIGQGNLTLPPPFPPFKLNNVLFAPNLVKNLISVRKLTTDNLLSIEFDPFGFTVKDLKTKAPLLRCNSSGDLYPLTAPLPLKTTPTAFVATTQDRWHQRLGHPGFSTLQSLPLSFSSISNKYDNTLCQACVFGKSVRFPFFDSCNRTSLPFDIIHSDLWTSPVPSTGGHRFHLHGFTVSYGLIELFWIGGSTPAMNYLFIGITLEVDQLHNTLRVLCITLSLEIRLPMVCKNKEVSITAF